ncbi:helix-turn-helix domain-containing protein [Streptomyces sp. NRRL S-237]|uniref:helix-turn-helix domain-containing protein n=2 Tax=Streptomyces TaxID=1883 RepID=UPI0004C5030C|nr:helix-turn-helix transcriptional regulator [Streptomyces sp. NRRL S-237]
MIRTDVLRLAQVRADAASGAAMRTRAAARLSLSEIADLCGVDPSTVWRWERGKRSPRGEAALAYARVLEDLAQHRLHRDEVA